MTFLTHKNFTLGGTGWGAALKRDIERVIDSVIDEFYCGLDMDIIPKEPVMIFHSSVHTPPLQKPKFVKCSDHSVIFLTSQDNYWCNYAYQFAHELCHYVIDANYPPKIDKFGWFEETICELASFYSLKKMSITWHVNPPNENWRDYHSSLYSFVSDMIAEPKNTINDSLANWLKINMSDLCNDRYSRDLNRIVAIQLLPAFYKNPELWTSIQYLKQISVTEDMTFMQYMSDWEKLIPHCIATDFTKMIRVFDS